MHSLYSLFLVACSRNLDFLGSNGIGELFSIIVFFTTVSSYEVPKFLNFSVFGSLHEFYKFFPFLSLSGLAIDLYTFGSPKISEYK